MQAEELGVVLQGRFDSFFSALPRAAGEPHSTEEAAGIGPVLLRSPESARLVLFSSADFLSDRVLNALASATGTQYLGPLELLGNTLDWALRNDQLLDIRTRAHFNRSLPPMERGAQVLIEYFNYGLAVLWLLLLATLHWLLRLLRRRRYARALGL